MQPRDTALRLFQRTRTEQSVPALESIFEELQPTSTNLSDDDLLSIIEYIESTCKVPIEHKFAHVNSFGTGGDGTLNITSMSAIVASNFCDVIKIGTSAVTSKFGATDFFSQAARVTDRIGDSVLQQKLMFQGRSQFLPLSEIGFPYRANLRTVRKRIKRRGLLDFYKVVFPISSYTNPICQVNGTSRPEYFDRYISLSQKLGRTAWIVHSPMGVDELLPGSNRIVFLHEGSQSYVEDSFVIPQSTDTPDSTIEERDSLVEQVHTFVELCSSGKPVDLRNTICFNAALLVAGFRGNCDLTATAQEIETKFFFDL